MQAGSSVKAPTPERKLLADVQTFQEIEAFAARLARVVRLALLPLLLRHTGNLQSYPYCCFAQHDGEQGGLKHSKGRAAPWERTPDVCTVPCGARWFLPFYALQHCSAVLVL